MALKFSTKGGKWQDDRFVLARFRRAGMSAVSLLLGNKRKCR